MTKKVGIKFAAFFFAFCMFAFGQTLTIDDAIVANMKYLSGRLPAGTKIVILNVESESRNLSDYIIGECDFFISNNTKLSLVDKSRIPIILQRKNINELNEINESTALEIGKELGASNVVLGSISKLGSNFRFRIQALGTADGKINGMQSLNVKEDDILLDLIETSGSLTKKRDADFDDLANLRNSGGFGDSQSARAKLEAETNDRNNPNQNVQVVIVRDTVVVKESPAPAPATDVNIDYVKVGGYSGIYGVDKTIKKILRQRCLDFIDDRFIHLIGIAAKRHASFNYPLAYYDEYAVYYKRGGKNTQKIKVLELYLNSQNSLYVVNFHPDAGGGSFEGLGLKRIVFEHRAKNYIKNLFYFLK
ncbi:MAG: hypothetical protein FWF51_08210 [Chitinivibrionia bacterium]|nr:hypothetical protein [Chitinivibrionia bacterium]